MTTQRGSDEMQEYKYIQFIQFNYFQVMNINFNNLFVYSYYYPIFLYVYIIASKIITFFTTVELMYFELSGVKKICLNSQEFSNFRILGFLTLFYMKRTLVVKKYDAWYRISCVFIWRCIGGRWLLLSKWNSFFSWINIKKFPS